MAFWDTGPCSLEADRHFRSAYCLQHHGKAITVMDVLRTSATSVNLKETTQRYIPEGYDVHIPRRENLKSHTFVTDVRMSDI
jgi:hypothetical protein